MSETEAAAEPTTEVEGGEKKPRKRGGGGGNKKDRSPKLKDWIRVQKSQAHGLPNKSVQVRLNTATGLCELITQAPVKEGSDELEPPRVQVFKFTDYAVIDDPNHNPLAVVEEEGQPAEAEPAAAPQ